jgi:DNA-binding winged helix-turn-helix (wHTH) protein
VLTREKLLEHVWDWVDASGTRTVDSHIKAVRRKLGADLIRTVHGVGYAFEPVTEGAGERPSQGPAEAAADGAEEADGEQVGA